MNLLFVVCSEHLHLDFVSIWAQHTWIHSSPLTHDTSKRHRIYCPRRSIVIRSRYDSARSQITSPVSSRYLMNFVTAHCNLWWQVQLYNEEPLSSSEVFDTILFYFREEEPSSLDILFVNWYSFDEINRFWASSVELIHRQEIFHFFFSWSWSHFRCSSELW